MSREEIHNCARSFPPVLLTDEEYLNIGKGGACMHDPYLEIALFQQIKKSLLARYFQLHSSTPYVLFPKLIDEYTNYHFS